MPKLRQKTRTYIIKAPQDNTVASSAFDEVHALKLYTKSASLFEEVFKQFHETNRGEKCSFEILATSQNVAFCFTAEETVAEVVKALIYSIAPEADIVQFKDPVEKFKSKKSFISSEVRLGHNSIFPLKTYEIIEGDSLSGLLNILCKLNTGEVAFFQMVVEPQPDTGSHQASMSAKKILARISHGIQFKYWIKRSVKPMVHEAITKKSQERLFKVNLRIGAMALEKGVSPTTTLKAISKTLSSYNTLDLNEFKVEKPKQMLGIRDFALRKLEKPFYLSCRELATIYHLPTERVAPNLIHVISHREPPPKELPVDKNDKEISFFGRTNFRGQSFPFGIRRIDRRRHLYVLGKSGVGKSKMLELLIKSDIENGHGVGILDPHGDLVDNVLRMVPEERIKDVILFDPSDLNFPPAFNPLEHVDEEYKMRVTIGFIEIFKKLFGDNWSPRLEHVLRYTTLALLDSPNTTVLSIMKMLTDKNYRQFIVRNIKDDIVKNFWVNEFAGWSEKFDNEAITPLLNKVGQFVSTNMIRNIVGQPDNLIDFRQIMDEKKILLMKISKGILGEENSSLLGAMAITKIYQAAMSRADTREDDRVDFYFYVDEFQNFATDTFDEILSESRKYRLNLTVANQFLGQLDERIKTTVFGNTGSLVSFRIGGEDALHLADEFSPRFIQRDLINLGVRDFVAKMSVEGETCEAFSARTLSMRYPEEDYTKECIEHSRRACSRPLEEVKQILSKWEEGDTDFSKIKPATNADPSASIDIPKTNPSNEGPASFMENTDIQESSLFEEPEFEEPLI